MRTQLGMQFAEKLDEVDFQGEQPIAKLDDVEPALSALHLAYQCLIATQAVSQVRLAEALPKARKLKLLQEYLVVTGVKSLGHGDSSAGP
jgi:hypothetical protein